MDTKFIDEAENLIKKYRLIMLAKSQVEDMVNGNEVSESFVLLEELSELPIVLHGLKAEALEAIESVLNCQYDKILSRLREL